MVKFLCALALASLAACSGLAPQPTPPPITLPVERALPLTATPPFTPTPYPWVDANSVMSGLCFELVYDAAGKTFVIRDAAALQDFFNLADNSHLCRHPVQRGSFDFSGDRILVGTWSKATGCTAQHQITDIHRDDDARSYVIFLRLVVQGGCDYELVRPFWISLSGLADYDVRLLVQNAG